MFEPTVPLGLPTTLLLRKTFDAMVGRLDGKLLCVMLAPKLSGVTLVYEKDEAPMLAFLLPGVPEPSDVQEYVNVRDVNTEVLYTAARYLRTEYGHWLLREGVDNIKLADSLELYANLLNLAGKD